MCVFFSSSFKLDLENGSMFYQEYGSKLAELGVVPKDMSAYRSLWQYVAPSGEETVIDFKVATWL